MVPRFLQALEDAGASAVRVDCYVTQQGVAAADILHEVALIQAGAVDAIVFTSTAEAQVMIVLRCVLLSLSSRLLTTSVSNHMCARCPMLCALPCTGLIACHAMAVMQLVAILLHTSHLSDTHANGVQGLVAAVGGVDGLAALVADNQLLLAAHGPYTAAGVTSTTGLPVPCVGHRFVTFDGVVSALEEHFS